MRMHRSPRLAATALLGTALITLVPLSPAHARTLPSVRPTAETAALYDDEAGGNANADDPAIWRNDAAPGRSLVVATAKEGGLRVYGLDASLVQSIAAPVRPRRRTTPPAGSTTSTSSTGSARRPAAPTWPWSATGATTGSVSTGSTPRSPAAP